ncbi:MAG TPA: hypothetical protein VJ914_13380 [Pseudonocardiaceae bacterium]|nr:hypothetical protein [Pseudonocardiaceae bacterium]
MNFRYIVRIPIAFGRAIGFGRSALRRDIDRVENLVILLAVVFFLLAVPLAVLVGIQARQSGNATMATQPAAHQTTAILTQNAPVQSNSLHSGNSVVSALAKWKTSSGQTRTGEVGAFSGQPAGSTVAIWIDASGNQVSPPLTSDDVDLSALLTVIALLVCVLIGIGSGLWLVRLRLNRRRFAAWDEDWRATEPRWTRRG